MIRFSLLLPLAAAVALSSCQTGSDPHAACATMPPYHGSAAFERMKTLVGKWSAESPMMGKMNTEFRLIAGESVIERTGGATETVPLSPVEPPASAPAGGATTSQPAGDAAAPESAPAPDKQSAQPQAEAPATPQP